ncbi:MAG: hypothetical protein PHY94_03805 [Candidatus Omnitrophica bacterium]|nr:hypothetical protein [Candidatus Omnitrophota bacterium]
MKNYKLLKNILVVVTALLFSAGISWAQGAASPSTPQEKEKQDKARKIQKNVEAAPLELSGPVVVSPGEEEKAEEAAKPAQGQEQAPAEQAPAELKEGQAVEQAGPVATEEGQNTAQTEAVPAAKSEK